MLNTRYLPPPLTTRIQTHALLPVAEYLEALMVQRSRAAAPCSFASIYKPQCTNTVLAARARSNCLLYLTQHAPCRLYLTRCPAWQIHRTVGRRMDLIKFSHFYKRVHKRLMKREAAHGRVDEKNEELVWRCDVCERAAQLYTKSYIVLMIQLSEQLFTTASATGHNSELGLEEIMVLMQRLLPLCSADEMSHCSAQNVIQNYDLDHTGQLTFREFVAMLGVAPYTKLLPHALQCLMPRLSIQAVEALPMPGMTGGYPISPTYTRTPLTFTLTLSSTLITTQLYLLFSASEPRSAQVDSLSVSCLSLSWIVLFAGSETDAFVFLQSAHQVFDSFDAAGSGSLGFAELTLVAMKVAMKVNQQLSDADLEERVEGILLDFDDDKSKYLVQQYFSCLYNLYPDHGKHSLVDVHTTTVL